MKKPLKIAIWVVGVIVALLALISVVAGPVAKGYINKHGEKITGRRVSVNHVGLNLFSGRVNVQGLSMYEDDGSTLFAGIDTLDVAARLLKLPFHTLHLSHVTLAGLHANVELQGEHFNFTSLIDHFAPDSTAEKDTTPSDWTLKLYKIRVSHARLSYRDLRTAKSWRLPDINLRVPGFVIGGDEGGQGDLNIGFDQGGKLKLGATYDANRNDFDVSLSLRDFNVENLESYLVDILDYKELKGYVEANITAKGNLDELMRSRIGGRVGVYGVDMVGRDGRVVAMDTLQVAVRNVDIDAKRYDIESVKISGLEACYEQWEGYSNISRLMSKDEREGGTLQPVPEQEQVEMAEAQGKDSPMHVRVGVVQVSDSKLRYIDHTMPEKLDLMFSGIGINGERIDLDGGGSAKVVASLPGGGSLVARWQGNIAQWQRKQDVSLTVKGMDMRQISPITLAYTGQPIEDGIFGLTSRATIIEGQLENNNQIDIYKVTVGKRRKNIEPEMKIPLRTALYILKDKDERIMLDLPVSGDVNSPEFSYMKLVRKTLGQLLVKVATSPARAIAGALGLDGQSLEFMTVDAQQSGFASEQYHFLSELAAVMKANKDVRLTITQTMPEAADDSTAIRYSRLNAQLLRYLTEQGVDESRIEMTSATPGTDGRVGYAISSQLGTTEEEY